MLVAKQDCLKTLRVSSCHFFPNFIIFYLEQSMIKKESAQALVEFLNADDIQ